MLDGVDPVTVVVADRERAFAQALAYRLGAEPSLEVVGSVYSAASAETEVAWSHPDIILLADTLERPDVATLMARLRARHEGLRIVGIVAEEDVHRASAVVQAGASAIVVKDSEITEVVRAIDAVARDEIYVPPQLLAGILREWRDGTWHSDEAAKIDRLTSRERQVLACMLAGLSRAEIAQRLVLSINTVRTHTRNVFDKLKVHSTLEAVSTALRAGFNDQIGDLPTSS